LGSIRKASKTALEDPKQAQSSTTFLKVTDTTVPTRRTVISRLQAALPPTIANILQCRGIPRQSRLRLPCLNHFAGASRAGDGKTCRAKSSVKEL
jgi:hypothetical protein